MEDPNGMKVLRHVFINDKHVQLLAEIRSMLETPRLASQCGEKFITETKFSVWPSLPCEVVAVHYKISVFHQ